SFVFHSHQRHADWLHILGGRGLTRIGDATREVGPGDFMGFATPSAPHLLRNTFEEECVYLMGGEDRPIDVVSYPDLDKRYLLMQTEKGTEFYELGEPTKPLAKPD
ncbi:MAG: cupin domain-containing protein, partial [Hyphomonadaceae bacterium]|nr:cupin domain-containing protein [Hyphomonadaceae bacterium]